MDADKRTAKKKVCRRCVICVTRTWAERMIWISSMRYLQNDTSTQFQDSSGALFFVVDWRLTIDTVRFAEQDGFCMRAAIKGIWVVLHDVLRCNRHLKSYRRSQVPYSSQSELWNLRHWQQFVSRSVRLFPQGPPETRFFEAVVSYNDLWLLPALPSM